MTLKAPALLFFIIFAVYLFTLHPSVAPYRDSGDLIVAASTLGISHPPGYPLYVLCGKVFDILIPFGNTAYHINVMSALFGAGAGFVLALCLQFVVGSSGWPLMAVFLLLFSPAYWRLSQVSEMYSFNAFFLSVILFFIIKLFPDIKEQKTNTPVFFVISFLCGLACTNHQTIVLIIPGFLWLLWVWGRFKPVDYVQGALFFILGLSVYLFIPVRFSTGPASSWGDPGTLEGFLRMITRSDYGGMKLHPEESKFKWTFGILVGHILVYIKSLAGQFTWPGMILGVIGIGLKIKDRFFKFLLISLLVSGPGFVILSNLPPSEETTLPILEPHFVLPNVIFMFFIAACVSIMASKVMGRLFILLVVILSFSANISRCNYRDHFFAYDYARNLFATLNQGSFIYNPDDSTAFITTYFQQVENKRRDLRLVAYYRTRWGYTLMKKRYPEILPAQEINSGRELEHLILDYNRLKYPIFTELPGKFPPNYISYPYGCMYKLSVTTEYEPDNSPFVFYATRGNYMKSDNYDFFTNHIISYFSSGHNNLGLAYAEKKEYGLAQKEYFSALSIDRNLSATYNNLGTLEYSRGDYEKALYWFNAVLKFNPNNDLVLFNLGLTYKAMQKYEQAQKYFLQLWQRNNTPNVGNELGLLYLYSGNANKAIDIFAGIIKIDPKYINAYYNLGLALQKAGRYQESKRCFKYYMDNIQNPKEKDEAAKIIKTMP